MKQFKISSFEIIDHGIDGSQYFPGCGTSYTPFDYVQTGCGQNALEAFDEALEQIAMSESVDLGAIEKSKEYKTANTKRAQRFTVEAYLKRSGQLKRNQDMSDLEGDCDLYYYVSILYSLAPSDEIALRSAGLLANQV